MSAKIENKEVDDDYSSTMSFHYNGYGKNLVFNLIEDNADYLPKILQNFAEFLRASGFVYVAAKKVPSPDGKVRSDYLFHSEYNWRDAQDLEDTNELDDINKAAFDYWGQAVDNAVWDKEKANTPKKSYQADVDNLVVGSLVYYHGEGTPDQQNEHHGYHGVSLKYSEGVVKMLTDTPLGKRALVSWRSWYDGHNGLGDDEAATVGDKSYWWSDVDNLYITNDL